MKKLLCMLVSIAASQLCNAIDTTFEIINQTNQKLIIPFSYGTFGCLNDSRTLAPQTTSGIVNARICQLKALSAASAETRTNLATVSNLAYEGHTQIRIVDDANSGKVAIVVDKK